MLVDVCRAGRRVAASWVTGLAGLAQAISLHRSAPTVLWLLLALRRCLAVWVGEQVPQKQSLRIVVVRGTQEEVDMLLAVAKACRS